MKSKRGTHVGVVLSFIIFVTFLVSIYTIILPATQTQSGKQSLVDYLKDVLVLNSTIDDLNTMTITITQTGGGGNQNCVKLSGGTAKSPLEQLENSGTPLKILDKDENIIGYREQGSQLLFGEIDNSYEGIMKVYYGTGLDSSPSYSGSAGCKNVDADQEYIRTESSVISSGISDLINFYETDYAQLKTDLGFPEESDFWFNFTYSDGTSIWPTGVEIPNTNVFVGEVPVQYIENDGGKQVGFLTINVW